MPHRILVVEDNPDLAAVLQLHLSVLGYEVELANSSLVATQKLLSFQPDLVVVDLMMPGSNGTDLIAQIRQADQAEPVPIVIHSGLPDTDNLVQAALNYDNVKYVLKGNIRDLSDAVEATLHESQAPAADPAATS